MFNKDIEKSIDLMIDDLLGQSREIIESSRTLEMASERITKVVSARVSAECESYIVQIYADLNKRVKDNPFFDDPQHLNDFYNLRLREQMLEKYRFDIHSLDSYKSGIQYSEVVAIGKATLESLGVTAVAGGLGVLLKNTLADSLTMPIIIIIAAVVGVAFFFLYAKGKMEKRDFQMAIDRYLRGIKVDITDWLTNIDNSFEEQVRSLIK